MNVKRNAGLTLVLLSLAVAGCNKSTPANPPPDTNATTAASETAPVAAVDASRAWLAALDAGHYDQAWEAVSAAMKSAQSRANFTNEMQTLHTKLGKVTDRKLRAQRNRARLPSTPPGNVWTLEYTATYANKADVPETLVLTLEPDGTWKVADYSVP